MGTEFERGQGEGDMNMIKNMSYAYMKFLKTSKKYIPTRI